MWEERCYSEGIPDEVPDLLIKCGKVPSYKEIALCILNNDLTLRGLGFDGYKSKWHDILKDQKNQKESNQIKLI